MHSLVPVCMEAWGQLLLPTHVSETRSFTVLKPHSLLRVVVRWVPGSFLTLCSHLTLYMCAGDVNSGGFPLTQPAFYLRRCSLQLLHYLDKREHFISLRVVANKYLTAAQEDVRKLDRVLLKGSVLLTGKQRVLREFKHEDI